MSCPARSPFGACRWAGGAGTPRSDLPAAQDPAFTAFLPPAGRLVADDDDESGSWQWGAPQVKTREGPPGGAPGDTFCPWQTVKVVGQQLRIHAEGNRWKMVHRWAGKRQSARKLSQVDTGVTVLTSGLPCVPEHP